MRDPFQELLTLCNLRLDNAAMNSAQLQHPYRVFLSILGELDPVIEIELLLKEIYTPKEPL